MGLGGDRVAAFEDALGEVGQLLRERGDVLRREGGGDGRVGALEEGVGDLDGGGAVTQRGERVDDPLGGVVALDDLLRVLLADPVALVVDDERGAVGGLGQDVDEAIDERALRGVEREREPGLAADRGCGGDAGAQRRGAERDDDLPDVLDVLGGEVGALLGGEEMDGLRLGRERTGEIELLEQAVGDDAADAGVEPGGGARFPGETAARPAEV